MGPKTNPVGKQTVVPSNNTQSKRQIGNLITHLAKSDNHLFQALNSLQNQTNGLIQSTTDWTSWNPAFREQTSAPTAVPSVIGQPLQTQEMSAYYMISGQLCFIEVYGQILPITSTVSILFDLPVDIGDTIIKTCAAYLYSPAVPTTAGNGIVMAVAISQTMKLVINTAYRNQSSYLAVGGMLGVIQLENAILGLTTPPPR